MKLYLHLLFFSLIFLLSGCTVQDGDRGVNEEPEFQNSSEFQALLNAYCVRQSAETETLRIHGSDSLSATEEFSREERRASIEEMKKMRSYLLENPDALAKSSKAELEKNS